MGAVDGRFAPVRRVFREGARVPGGDGRGRRGVGGRNLGRRPLGRIGRRCAHGAVAARQHRHAVLGLQTVRRPVRAAAGRSWFARTGRARATVLAGFAAPASVRHVLSHQAGIVALDAPAPTEAFYDWDRMCALLAAQPPWVPGAAHGESALFFGHLVGELVRRVDGRSRDGSCARRSADGWGWTSPSGCAPTEQARAVDLTGLDAGFSAAPSSCASPWPPATATANRRTVESRLTRTKVRL